MNKLISFYQKNLSPYLKYILPFSESGCRFYPTCSDYTKMAIQKYGPIKGSFKGLIRVLKCNPLHKGGFDYP